MESKMIVVGAVAAVLLIAVGLGIAPLLEKQTNEIRVSWDMNAAPAKASAGQPTSTTLVVYDDLVFVSQRKTASFASELNELIWQGATDSLLLESVQFKDFTDPDARVFEQAYLRATNAGERIRESIGKEVTVIIGEKELHGTLVNADGSLVLKTANGLEVIPEYARLILPDSGEILYTPSLKLIIGTKNPGQHNIEIDYLSTSAGWRASHTGLLKGDYLYFKTNAIINSEYDFDGAKLVLVAGNLNRQSNYGPYPAYAKAMVSEARDTAGGESAPSFEESSSFEYHKYTLDQKVDFKKGEQKNIEMFSAKVPVQKRYDFNSGYYWYGSGEKGSVSVSINFTNNNESGLGKPIPGGKVTLYAEDKEGETIFAGEDSIGHTAEGEKITLRVGTAFDLNGERKVASTEQRGNCGDSKKIEVELRNAKEEDVFIYVTEYVSGDWKIYDNNVEYSKKDANTVEFKVPVKAKSTNTLKFTIDSRWC